MRIQAAVSALAVGDPLGALQHVALHEDASSLALRGIALAQIGDLARASKLLTRAVRGFGAAQPLAGARCVVALAEVALAARELNIPLAALERAQQALAAAGDDVNALHARLVLARSLVTLGQLTSASQVLANVRLRHAPPALVASAELVRAELALRTLDVTGASSALERGRRAAQQASVPALEREIVRVQRGLAAPAARLVSGGEVRSLSLSELRNALNAKRWLVNGFTRSVRFRERTLSLLRRPVLFGLLGVLAEAWPQGASRSALIAAAFGVAQPNATHRARLRVEIGRLRKLLARLGSVSADEQGYRLALPVAAKLAVLKPLRDGEEAELMAVLADGQSWSSAKLAEVLGRSQRSCQRLLLELQKQGAVRSIGRGRARRWVAAPVAELGVSVLGLFRSELMA